ncbi:MAG TPA: hypothetical protein VHX20_01810 [Terracidiphilus sp.]|jgi:hypothetical protein|nr:hypothetical protein [Terracidiphilus sp.]
MATSIEDLRIRLRKFLDDPRSDKEFRGWFASLLIDINQENDSQVERLVRSIHLAFSDAAEGLHSAEELKALLLGFANTPGEAPTAESGAKFAFAAQPFYYSAVVVSSELRPFYSGGSVAPPFYSYGTASPAPLFVGAQETSPSGTPVDREWTAA